VLSDPAIDPKTLIVNFSTVRAQLDPACVVRPGEHKCITAESYIYYRGAQIRDADFLLRYTKPVDPLTDELLNRVVEGAAMSDFLKVGHLEILIRQEIIVC
jgi:hypothetical protein